MARERVPLKDTLFRNSFWDNDSHIMLDRLGRLVAPTDHPDEDWPHINREPADPEPVSHFSDNSSDTWSLYSAIARSRRSTGPEDGLKSLPPVPRAYTLRRQKARRDVHDPSCLRAWRERPNGPEDGESSRPPPMQQPPSRPPPIPQSSRPPPIPQSSRSPPPIQHSPSPHLVPAPLTLAPVAPAQVAEVSESEYSAETRHNNSDPKGYPGLSTPKTSTDQTLKGDRPARPSGMTLRFEAFLVGVVCTAQVCALGAIGQTLALLQTIASTFNLATTGYLLWFIAAYGLSMATFIVIGGRLGDVFGQRLIFLVGLVWSGVWTAVAGASYFSGPTLFIVCRSMQGSGAALTLPTGLALLGQTFAASSQRYTVYTIFTAAGTLGLLFGALGGALPALIWWPITYWLFAFFLAVTASAGVYVIPPSARQKNLVSTHDFVSELDIPGAICGMMGLVLFAFAWIQAAVVGWQTPYLWLALIVGTLLVSLFFMIENYYAPRPLVPFQALSVDALLLLAAVACGWACFAIWVFYSWQIIENARGAPPLLATAYFVPVLVIGIFTSTVSGHFLAKCGPLTAMTTATGAFKAALILISTAPVDQNYWAQTFVCMLLAGWGMDTMLPSATVKLSSIMDRRHQDCAGSLVMSVMNYGATIGLAIAGTVEYSLHSRGVVANLPCYHAALLAGVGMGGLSLILCCVLAVKEYCQRHRRRPRCCQCHGALDESTTLGDEADEVPERPQSRDTLARR